MSQSETQTREVEPNARYDAIYGTNYSGEDPVSDDEGLNEIQRKVRTGDVEWYLNALLVVRGVKDTEGA